MKKKSTKYWSFESNYNLVDGWKKPTKQCPIDYSFVHDGRAHILADYVLIHEDNLPDIPDQYLENADIDDLGTLIGNEITNIIKNSMPKVLVWEYEDKNLLPSAVDIDGFSNNPNSCIPLQNMFLLAGYDDIKKTIEYERKGTTNKFQNFLDRVANKTTKHFKNVWKE